MVGAASLTKVSIPTALAICQDIQLEPDALKCLDSDPEPVQFLNALLAQQIFPDTVRFLARALPKREATWWACLCARSAIDSSTKPEVVKALEAAEQWVYKSTEPNRRLTNVAAHAASFENAAAWAAMAAFWSEGSMAI